MLKAHHELSIFHSAKYKSDFFTMVLLTKYIICFNFLTFVVNLRYWRTMLSPADDSGLKTYASCTMILGIITI
jgi:hypothetical protein